jgi:hypothetical protein
MKQISTVLAKNALANLLRGLATAMAALALPHFPTKSVGQAGFAAWLLLLQMSACTSYLGFRVFSDRSNTWWPL